jgi:hypothetical protein
MAESPEPSVLLKWLRVNAHFVNIVAVIGFIVGAVLYFLSLPSVLVAFLVGGSFVALGLSIVAKVSDSGSAPVLTLGSLTNDSQVMSTEIPLFTPQPPIPIHGDVLSEIERRYELKKLEPNFIESSLENIPAHNDESGIIVRGDAPDPGESFRAYVVPYSNYSNIRKIAIAEKVSVRITYICFVGEQPKWLMIDRGAWLSEKESEFDFAVNSTPRRAIVATAEGDEHRVYAVRRDFDSEYQGPMTIREELRGSVFGVTVNLLAKSRTETAKTFSYILEIIRQPVFEVRLTNAVLWKTGRLGKFLMQGHKFWTRIHEIFMEAHTKGEAIGNYFDEEILAGEKEQEAAVAEEMKTWIKETADFIGLYLDADKKNKFLDTRPSIDNGLARVSKSAFERMGPPLRTGQAAAQQRVNLPYWTLSDSMKARLEMIEKFYKGIQ